VSMVRRASMLADDGQTGEWRINGQRCGEADLAI